ncbi:MAG: hypothetical protein EOO38_19330 [Cytophagaceae bacterium]|nr:MAG: hypothetical protein EOO38_19330 [Cytophagaceae bacterium]
MVIIEQNAERLQPRLREALVTSIAEHDALAAQHSEIEQQIAAQKGEHAVLQLLLEGAQRDYENSQQLHASGPLASAAIAALEQTIAQHRANTEHCSKRLKQLTLDHR